MCLQNCGNTLIVQDQYAYPEGKNNVTKLLEINNA